MGVKANTDRRIFHWLLHLLRVGRGDGDSVGKGPALDP
ncbi:hypothetical protein CSX11_11275 [Mycobacterium goodii]|nr:hypothetical protein CSX11_11275 [Mycolicibacterium goodii]